MIITRSPLRISLGGGGTDLPSYYRHHGGFLVSAAIDKYVYTALNTTFTPKLLLKYSKMELVYKVDDVEHPIIREALRFYDVPPNVEIVSISDIPSGTGLGSSGAFTVGLCTALSAYMECPIDQTQAFAHAAHIELDILGRPGGKQDHVATAFGGLRAIDFHKNDYVTDQTIPVPQELEQRLHLYYTGYRRDADIVLSTQTTDGLDEIKRAGYKAHSMLLDGGIDGLGALMNDHWELKKLRSSQISNPQIDYAYEVALDNGAIGGKLVGAGSGGFLMFVSDDAEQLAHAMNTLGMPEVPFKFDHVGTTLLAS